MLYFNVRHINTIQPLSYKFSGRPLFGMWLPACMMPDFPFVRITRKHNCIFTWPGKSDVLFHGIMPIHNVSLWISANKKVLINLWKVVAYVYKRQIINQTNHETPEDPRCETLQLPMYIMTYRKNVPNLGMPQSTTSVQTNLSQTNLHPNVKHTSCQWI